FGITPIAGMGDDAVQGFNVPTFLYAGHTWSSLAIASNGYIEIGAPAGTSTNASPNQNLPNPTAPNNILAPFWTNLDPSAGGAVRIGTLTDGADTWIVVDWQNVVTASNHAIANSFEAWIGVNTDAHPGEDISFAYGAMGGADQGHVTVGAEDWTGTVG